MHRVHFPGFPGPISRESGNENWPGIPGNREREIPGKNHSCWSNVYIVLITGCQRAMTFRFLEWELANSFEPTSALPDLAHIQSGFHPSLTSLNARVVDARKCTIWFNEMRSRDENHFAELIAKKLMQSSTLLLPTNLKFWNFTRLCIRSQLLKQRWPTL